MGRGTQDVSQSGSLLYGPNARTQRPKTMRIRSWAEENPVEYANVIAFLDIDAGSYRSFLQIVEEKAGAEHDCVRNGDAEIVIEKIMPTSDGEVAVDYSLSPLGEEELQDDPEHAIVLDPAELREEEIFELAAPELCRRHRAGELTLPA